LAKREVKNRSLSDERSSEALAVPVVAEVATVRKRRVDTGRGVRIRKTVSEREEVIDEPLEREELRIERVPINRVVDDGDLPAVRHEGDVTIVPVLEEVIVIEKRTVLKEEVRITRVRRQVHEPQRVILRSEEVTTEEFVDPSTRRAPPAARPAEPPAGDLAGDIQPME
jgi:uncharacterized protein (TIGR02271 family)